METQHIKVPALSKKLGIPSDRIYKWFQTGGQPKAGDSVKIWNWINGVYSTNEEASFVREDEELYNSRIDDLIRIIEKQQETIHFLSTGQTQGGGSRARNASGSPG